MVVHSPKPKSAAYFGNRAGNSPVMSPVRLGLHVHACYIELIESRAFFGQLVDRRRSSVRMSITTEISVTKVVGKHKDDVWRALIGRLRLRNGP